MIHVPDGAICTEGIYISCVCGIVLLLVLDTYIIKKKRSPKSMHIINGSPFRNKPPLSLVPAPSVHYLGI